MLDRGHEVVVLVGGQGSVTERLKDAGIPFRSLRFLRRPVRPVSDLRALVEMAGVMQDWKPDLVSAHTAKAGCVGRAVCARLRIPVVYTPHGWSVSDRISPIGGVVFSVAERQAAKWSSAIICVCEYERQLALKKRIAPVDKLCVVYNGVRDVPAELRARPGREPVRLATVARLEAPKDFGTLLRALAALQTLAWELDVVGDGPLEPEMRELAGKLGIGGRVHFLGYRREPASTLAGAQVFVLSSRSEGFPRSVLEAMRAGLPVVASDVGGIGEAVTDGVSGFLVPRESPELLSEAFGRLIADAGEREDFGAAARRAYESKFRLEVMAEETAAVYASVLSRQNQLGRVN